ncbi:unnamed protein product [Moneuplotes crassus]|uniref:Uncharacterized protein n=1 Tax=Euplotes crassus TaxID=5936 RepID=A0AAD1UQR1_EUPCR|nr:unnamed protein product [Moneuplotes crassus]
MEGPVQDLEAQIHLKRGHEESTLKKERKKDHQVFKDLYSYSGLEQIRLNKEGLASFDTKVEFRLFFGQPKDKEFIRKVWSIPLFTYNAITCDQSSNGHKYISKFLNTSFPIEVNEFAFIGTFGMKTNISKYFNSIMRLGHRVLKDVFFSRLKLNRHQLKRLLASFKHVKCFRILSCKLCVPYVFDLSKALINTQIAKINLSYCGDSDNCDWENNPQEFTYLIQSLATSVDLKLTLSEIKISHCEINRDEAQQILQDNDLGSVQVIC